MFTQEDWILVKSYIGKLNIMPVSGKTATAKYVQMDASLRRTLNSQDCEVDLNSRLIGHNFVFCPMIPFLVMNKIVIQHGRKWNHERELKGLKMNAWMSPTMPNKQNQ